MNIDYNAVTEILKIFLNNEKTEILGISVGEERQIKDAIKNLITAYEEKGEECDFLDKELYNANQEIQDLQLNIEKEKEKNKELEKKLDEISEINFPIIT